MNKEGFISNINSNTLDIIELEPQIITVKGNSFQKQKVLTFLQNFRPWREKAKSLRASKGRRASE